MESQTKCKTPKSINELVHFDNVVPGRNIERLAAEKFISYFSLCSLYTHFFLHLYNILEFEKQEE